MEAEMFDKFDADARERQTEQDLPLPSWLQVGGAGRRGYALWLFFEQRLYSLCFFFLSFQTCAEPSCGRQGDGSDRWCSAFA